MALKFNHMLNEISTDSGSLILEGAGSLQVPIGISSDRPLLEDGQIRYNTTSSKFEFKENSNWVTYPSNLKIYVQVSADSAPTIQAGNIIIFNRTINSSDSDITVNITQDGTLSADPLFNDLTQCSITINPIRDTASDNESPWCHIRSITDKSIRFQVKRSNTTTMLIGDGDTYSGNVNNTAAISIQINVTGIEHG